jgi:hypothetical protein
MIGLMCMDSKDLNKIALNVGKVIAQIEDILKDIEAFEDAEMPSEISLPAIHDNLSISLDTLKECGEIFLKELK